MTIPPQKMPPRTNLKMISIKKMIEGMCLKNMLHLFKVNVLMVSSRLKKLRKGNNGAPATLLRSSLLRKTGSNFAKSIMISFLLKINS